MPLTYPEIKYFQMTISLWEPVVVGMLHVAIEVEETLHEVLHKGIKACFVSTDEPDNHKASLTDENTVLSLACRRCTRQYIPTEPWGPVRTGDVTTLDTVLRTELAHIMGRIDKRGRQPIEQVTL